MDKENESKNQLKEHDHEIPWEVTFLEEKDEEWEREKTDRKKRKSLLFKMISSLLAITMLITGLQIWFDLFNLPAIRFLEASKRLSENAEVRELKKAVVKIEWDGVKGTGFNIEQNGLIITNEHVVDHTNKVKVYFNNGLSYNGTVTSKNKELDLAVVDINAEKLPVLPLSSDKGWEKWTGDRIIFIGNPLAFTQIANEGKVTGKINVQDMRIPVMMIEAPVYKGNSGSPVLNDRGEVIGVIFATITSNEINKQIAVATPSYYIQEVLEPIN